MKRIVAVIALACAAVLPAACEQKTDAAAEDVTAAAADAAPAAELAAAPSAIPAPSPAATDASAGTPAVPGAPDFAVMYPAATLDAPAVVANGPTGPGGLATYSTDADPEAVIAFHRAQAEAAGLTSAMEMNQGEARAYGATSGDGGKSLQVVASATEGGPTSVQLTWSAGR